MFVSICTNMYLLCVLGYNQIMYYSFCYYNCSRFGHWELFPVSSHVLLMCPILLFFERFITFWYYKMLQTALIIFCSLPIFSHLFTESWSLLLENIKSPKGCWALTRFWHQRGRMRRREAVAVCTLLFFLSLRQQSSGRSWVRTLIKQQQNRVTWLPLPFCVVQVRPGGELNLLRCGGNYSIWVDAPLSLG